MLLPFYRMFDRELEWRSIYYKYRSKTNGLNNFIINSHSLKHIYLGVALKQPPNFLLLARKITKCGPMKNV